MKNLTKALQEILQLDEKPLESSREIKTKKKKQKKHAYELARRNKRLDKLKNNSNDEWK